MVSIGKEGPEELTEGLGRSPDEVRPAAFRRNQRLFSSAKGGDESSLVGAEQLRNHVHRRRRLPQVVSKQLRLNASSTRFPSASRGRFQEVTAAQARLIFITRAFFQKEQPHIRREQVKRRVPEPCCAPSSSPLTRTKRDVYRHRSPQAGRPGQFTATNHQQSHHPRHAREHQARRRAAQRHR